MPSYTFEAKPGCVDLVCNSIKGTKIINLLTLIKLCYMFDVSGGEGASIADHERFDFLSLTGGITGCLLGL